MLSKQVWEERHAFRQPFAHRRPETPRLPWLAEAGALNRDSLYEDYAREAKRLGITDTLHMEVDVAEDNIERETDYVKELSRQPGSLLRGAVAACRPESTSFPAYLERVLADPFVKGFRRVLHVVPDDVSEGALFAKI